MSGRERAALRAGEIVLGRDGELARLAGLIEGDVPVAIVGEAGVGKTTLARTALRRSGRRYLEGGGFGTWAWAPFLALERAIGRSLAGADADYAVREVARSVGSGVLLIDDAQWVDPGTRTAIAGLAGHIGLIVTIRRGDPETDAVVRSLTGEFERLDLEPLDEDDAADIARLVRPDLGPAEARRIARRAGGNPLLVTELAAGGSRAVNLASAVRVRLDALDAAGRDAMALLALAGRPMAPAALGPGAGLLVSTGLAVVEANGGLRVRHDLIGEASVEDLAADDRRRLHARLARLVEDDGEAARHHALAGERSLAHARAMEASRSAASAGERAGHLVLAAETSDVADGVALRIQAAHVMASHRFPDRALALLGDLLGGPDPAAALAEARAHHAGYDLDLAQAAIARGLAHLDPDAPDSIATEIGLRIEAARVAVAALEDGRHAVDLALEADTLAVRHGIETTAARAALGSARYLARDMGGLDDLALAMDEALADEDTLTGLGIGDALVFNLLKVGRAGAARALAERLERQARGAHLARWERRFGAWALGCAWHAGDLVDAVAMAEALGAENVGKSALQDWYRIQVLADLGFLDEARIRAEWLLSTATAGEYDLGEALWLAADVACLSGRWKDAVAYAERHAREVPGAHHRIFVELPGAWAAFELGRPADWPVHVAALPMAEGGAIELEALRALATGHLDEAGDRFDAAAAAWAGRHARGELRSRWAAAESIRRAGRLDEARKRLLTLEDRLEAVAHAPFLARTRRSLRLVGIRRAATHQRVAGSPLTARELEILEMTGRGLRDGEVASRLGISRWAVVRAAESAGAKLGTASRAEAVAAASLRSPAARK